MLTWSVSNIGLVGPAGSAIWSAVEARGLTADPAGVRLGEPAAREARVFPFAIHHPRLLPSQPSDDLVGKPV